MSPGREEFRGNLRWLCTGAAAIRNGMTRRWWPALAVAGLLSAMFALMRPAVREDSATIDEPVFLGAGYSYWLGHRYYFNAEHPPLMQLWSALPLRWLPVRLPPHTEKYLDQPSPLPTSTTWEANIVPREQPTGFYTYPHLEAGYFGQALLYRGVNNADQLLTWARLMQVVITLATGLVIFGWARSLSNTTDGLIGLTTWVLNPMALAYGHLVITDPGLAFLFALALWSFDRFAAQPNPARAALAGLTIALALLTKYAAVVLFPVCAVVAALHIWRDCSKVWQWLVGLSVMAVTCYGVILLCYAPHWAPPPPITTEMAARLKVPTWFTILRPVLVPRDYFRGLALMLVHAKQGHLAFLCGQWSERGWWYYFPVALALKTPVALLGLAGLCRVNRRDERLVPLLGVLIFLGFAMTSHTDIGVRHVLPVFPLLSVVVGASLAKASRGVRIAGWVLCGWLAIVAVRSCPDYIPYFNELAGGAAHGHEYLVDSNLDWGQDVKWLKIYAEQHHIEKLAGSYFGPGGALAYYGIPFTGMDSQQLATLHEADVVVSATWLMRPEYAWLRQQHQPVARIGHGLFVYRLP